MSTFSPVRSTTTTFSIDGVSWSASSALAFKVVTLPPRGPPSAVTRTFASQSLMRSRNESAEKAPKTTECGAPMRAQASIAIGSSGIMGK
jgi:hypothetical protein